MQVAGVYGPQDRYAAWQPAEMYARTSRRRAAAELLTQERAFPQPDEKCLEVGFGLLGWLAQLIDWGVHETSLSGIDLHPARVEFAKRALPAADLRVGNATALPWSDGTFKLVIASTTFTSILDAQVRAKVAQEIVRVMAPGGALLYYDFAFNSPDNPNVRKVDRDELVALFPSLKGSIVRTTLAPPLARFVAPKSWILASALELVPFLRTHLIAVLKKDR